MTAVFQSSLCQLVRERAVSRRPVVSPEVRMMLKIMAALGWVNLIIGLPSILLVLFLGGATLLFTGLLSTLTFWLLRMTAHYIRQSLSWTEVGLAAMCGVYFPVVVIWLCTSNLIEAIPG